MFPTTWQSLWEWKCKNVTKIQTVIPAGKKTPQNSLGTTSASVFPQSPSWYRVWCESQVQGLWLVQKHPENLYGGEGAESSAWQLQQGVLIKRKYRAVEGRGLIFPGAVQRCEQRKERRAALEWNRKAGNNSVLLVLWSSHFSRSLKPSQALNALLYFLISKKKALQSKPKARPNSTYLILLCTSFKISTAVHLLRILFTLCNAV